MFSEMLEPGDEQFRRTIIGTDFQAGVKLCFGQIPALAPIQRKTFREMLSD